MNNNRSYNLYCWYLKAKNKYSETPIRCGSIEAFRKRKDIKSFTRLVYFLHKNNITSPNELELFLVLNAKRLGPEFYPFNLSNQESLDHYNKEKKKYLSSEKYFDFVFSGFKFIDEFCKKNNYNIQSYFKEGKIPKIIKDFKTGNVPEDIIVYSKILKSKDLLFKNKILNLYAKDLINRISLIENRIETNPKLRDMLEKGFKWLIKNQKNRNFRKKQDSPRYNSNNKDGGKI